MDSVWRHRVFMSHRIDKVKDHSNANKIKVGCWHLKQLQSLKFHSSSCKTFAPSSIFYCMFFSRYFRIFFSPVTDPEYPEVLSLHCKKKEKPEAFHTNNHIIRNDSSVKVCNINSMLLAFLWLQRSTLVLVVFKLAVKSSVVLNFNSVQTKQAICSVQVYLLITFTQNSLQNS